MRRGDTSEARGSLSRQRRERGISIFSFTKSKTNPHLRSKNTINRCTIHIINHPAIVTPPFTNEGGMIYKNKGLTSPCSYTAFATLREIGTFKNKKNPHL